MSALRDFPFLLLVGMVLCLFFGIGYLAQRLSVPSVLAFILLGMAASIFVGDAGLINHLSEIGITMLFFVIGLEFSFARMWDISKKVWPGGLLDAVLCLGGGTALALLFHLDLFSSLVIGGVIYASSSSITVKLLEEKKRLANPETEFILALLVFEDIAAPVLVSLLAGIGLGHDVSARLVLSLLFKIVVLFSSAAVCSIYGFRKLRNFFGAHLEKDYLPLLAIGVALLYGGISVTLGLSEILGAFLAGAMLSETGRAPELEHIISPVRDLTLPFFFFCFGTTITLEAEGASFATFIMALVLWSVFSKVLAGYWGGKFFGLPKRAALRAGFSLVQRGEFSVVIAAGAAPTIRVLSSIYILITAVAGVAFFQKAPFLASVIYNFLEARRRR